MTRPSTTIYHELAMRLEHDNYVKNIENPTEQDLLVSHFANSTKTQFVDEKYNFRPQRHKESLEEDAVTVHWIGNPKPWSLILGGETTIQDLDCNPGVHQPWSTSLYQCAMEQYFAICHNLKVTAAAPVELPCLQNIMRHNTTI